MTTKNNLAVFVFIIILTLFSCNNSGNHKSNGNDIKSQVNKKAIDNSIIPINFGGEYSFGEDIEKGRVGSIIIYPLTNNSALFFLDVCNGAPSYNQGQLLGQISLKDNVGIYNSKNDDDDFNCILKFKFSSGKLEVITETGYEDCGFGGNVYADNKYKLINKSTPNYFINAESDTIQFKGLSVYKYYHRFD